MQELCHRCIYASISGFLLMCGDAWFSGRPVSVANLRIQLLFRMIQFAEYIQFLFRRVTEPFINIHNVFSMHFAE